MQNESLTLKTPSGATLHVATWHAQDAPATVVISHGLGEHAGRYEYVARSLAAPPSGFEVVAFDYRGHGRSSGRRGAVRRFDELYDDLQTVIAHVAQRPAHPLFLLGHSLGGVLALRAALEAPDRYAGLVLSSPALKLAMPVPAWKRGAGELLRLLAPSLAISGPVPVDWLATRPGYAQEHKADHLRHSKICAHIYFGMREWGTRLLASAPRQNVPLFVLAGAHDRVVSPEAAAQLVATWGHPDATLHLIPEGGHEPLNDGYRDDLLQQIRSWIQSRVQKTNARHSTLETHPPNLLKYAT